MMVDMLLKDRSALMELVAPVVIRASSDRVRRGLRNSRNSLLRSVERIETRSNVVALAQALLDFPLQSGKRLRDATRTEVLSFAEFQERQGKRMMHMARWLSVIAQAVPDGKVVGDVMDDKRAAELLKETENG
jgi:hypothetical protein